MLRQGTSELPIFANGAVTGAFAYMFREAAIQAAGSGTTPAGISNSVSVDKSLGLSVKGNTLSGDIVVDCASVSAAMCSSSIADFKGINQSAGGYTVALTVNQAGPGGVPNFSLHGGGSHPKYNGWWSPSAREIHLFPGNAGYTSETTVHEFGHFLGLAHQANPTNSFMSYSTTRHAVPGASGLKRLVEAYR